MKRIMVFCMALALLVGCGGQKAAPQVQLDARAEGKDAPAVTAAPMTAAPVDPTEAPAGPAEASAPETMGLAEALTARWAEEGLLEGMVPFAPEDVYDYYGIDLSACTGGAVFRDAVGYTNEAAILTGDSAVLDEAEAMLRAHLDAVKEQFRDYDAQALALAEKAVLIREGDAVLFLISPNADDMLAAFRDLVA